MLEQEFEERLDVLEKKVEELTTELHEVKKERVEEVTLIPGAEYDFVPTIRPKVIARGFAKFVGFVDAPKGLGLSPSEWALISDDEEPGG